MPSIVSIFAQLCGLGFDVGFKISFESIGQVIHDF